VFETLYFGQRTLFQLIFSGVFERHPNLKFTFTELGGGFVRDMAPTLDGFVHIANVPDSIPNMFAGRAAAKLSMLPSEYCQRNCYISSMLAGTDAERRYEIGMDRLMWGADFPHHEGTAPHTKQALRGLLSSVPENELRQLLAGNAAKLYGADLDFLQGVADKIGPTVAEVAVPLRADEIPADPNFGFLLGHARMSMAGS
jgi:predicted TIM-barrel fold metal-dependent hydrolase